MFVTVFVKRKAIEGNSGDFIISDLWVKGPFENYGESMDCTYDVELDGTVDFWIKELNEKESIKMEPEPEREQCDRCGHLIFSTNRSKNGNCEFCEGQSYG